MQVDKLSEFEILVKIKPEAFKNRPVDWAAAASNVVEAIKVDIGKVIVNPAVFKVNKNVFPQCITNQRNDLMGVSIVISWNDKHDRQWLCEILGKDHALYQIIAMKDFQPIYNNVDCI